ncbi:hypothetical protein JB92DRAFT_3111193 [Gautieria morchelliformis]|nr:hypothetical protein JB92DRAFT_3111193 [Gautieria morchelliformis]
MESELEVESEMESELSVVSELEMENRVSPDMAPVWKDIGQVLTTKLPDWFDAQYNDYNPYRLTTSAAVVQSWFGHPSNTPVDVRA